MSTSQMSVVVQCLRRAVLRVDRADQTDAQLLESYISHREPAALEVLVRRHAGMVWGVCRRVLRNHHDAEDAFQATFLVLVRRAAAVTPREKVGNWLYGVAHQTAMKAKSTRAKLRMREAQQTTTPEPAEMGLARSSDLNDLLDQELALLPERFRAVIVLCDLEGRTRREAAQAFGCPEGTVASRLAKARTLLAEALARHGLALSGCVLASALARTASAAAPASVVASTIKAVTLVAAGQAVTASASASVVALTEGVLKAMLVTKLNSALTVLVVLGMVAFGGVVLTHDGRAGAQAVAAEPNQEADGETARREAERNVQAASVNVLRARKELARAEAVLARAKERLRKVIGEKEAKDETSKLERNQMILKKETDTQKLQGTWVVIEIRADGETRPVPEGFDARLIIKGDEFHLMYWAPATPQSNERNVWLLDATFKLNTKTSPPNIDLTTSKNPEEHALCLGIYKFDGDHRLRLCLSRERPSNHRPADFKAEKGSNQEIYVLRRASKHEAADQKAGQTIDPAEGTRAVGVKLPKGQVIPDGVHPGTFVDVVAEISKPVKTNIAVQGVKVLATDGKDAEQAVVTVQVTPAQAAVLAQMQQPGARLAIRQADHSLRIEAERILEDAFGKRGDVSNLPVKLELRANDIFIAAQAVVCERDGRVSLKAVKAVVFQNQEAVAICCEEILLTFHRPIDTVADIDRCRITNIRFNGWADSCTMHRNSAPIPQAAPSVMKSQTNQKPTTPQSAQPKTDVVGKESAHNGIKPGRGTADYTAIFARTLVVLTEHFENIEYANRYDGRIEARGTVPAKEAPGLIRKAAVTIQPAETGGFVIDVRINKFKEAEPRTMVEQFVGRDAELERRILQRLQAEKADSDATTK